MLLDSNWREELRLLRLNNPAYRIVFLILDILRWFAYLAGALLLVAVCWYIVTPREYVPPPTMDRFGNTSPAHADTQDNAIAHNAAQSDRASEPVSAAAVSHNADTGAEPPITEERIAYLKSFANRVKRQAEDPADNRTIEHDSDLNEGEQQQSRQNIEAAQAADGWVANPGLTGSADVTVFAVPAPDAIVSNIISNQPAADQPGSEQPGSEQLASDQEDAVMPAKSSEQSNDGSALALENSNSRDEPASEGELPPEVVAVVTPQSLDNTSNATKASGGADLSYTPNNRPYAGSEWIMAQDSNHYTIQIGSTGNRPFLVRFVDTLPEPHLAAVFNFRINRWDRWEHVLTYGSFASKEEANRALAKLSQANRRYGAFARSFKVIREDMDTTETVTAQTSGSGAVPGQ